MSIQADTRNLDAAKAKQSGSIKADTSGLDAAKARQSENSGSSLRQDLAKKESEKAKEAEARSANNSARAASNRESRELRRMQISGRVSSFLKRKAESDGVLRATVGLLQARDPLSSAQAVIEYGKAIGGAATSGQPSSGGGDAAPRAPQTVLPPRPGDEEVYYLASKNTELKWEEGLPTKPDDAVMYFLTTQNSQLTWEVGGVGGGGGPHPFQVRLQTNQGSTSFVVESASKLYTGLGSYTAQALTGSFSGTASQGFLFLSANVSNGSVSSASIVGPAGSVGNRITSSNGQQTGFTYPIAYMFLDGDTFRVRQLCFQDLTLIDICINGVSCKYPFAV